MKGARTFRRLKAEPGHFEGRYIGPKFKQLWIFNFFIAFNSTSIFYDVVIKLFIEPFKLCIKNLLIDINSGYYVLFFQFLNKINFKHKYRRNDTININIIIYSNIDFWIQIWKILFELILKHILNWSKLHVYKCYKLDCLLFNYYFITR